MGARLNNDRSGRRGVQLLSAIFGMLILGATLLTTRAYAQQSAGLGAFPAEAVKAVFLYRFAGYVQWPAASANQTRFVVAVMGADDVAAQLERLLPDHPVHGLPAEVHRIGALASLGDAQMLYVGPGFDGNLAALLARMRGRAVLVVTDRDGALESGSMVNFLLESGHVRFEVSLTAARQAGLAVSSALLAVAQRVKTGDLHLLPACAPLQSRSAGCTGQVAAR